MIGLRWLFIVPVVATALLFGKFISAWAQLPDRVAVHFGVRGQPNQWASKSSFAAIIVFLSIALIVASVLVCYYVPMPVPVIVVAVSGLSAVATFWQTIDFNLTGRPLRIAFIVVPEILLLVLLFFIFLLNRRVFSF